MDDKFGRRRRRMVRNQERRGEIGDPRVLAAMGAVPRHEFVPAALQDEAYDERALPIGDGQTISQPLIVALMTEALELGPRDRVLEVGSGSGYQAAILRRLVPHVVGVERVGALAERARSALVRLGVDGVEIHEADGSLGWPADAPYDAIVVTAGGPRLPEALLGQLAAGGRLVMPVGPRNAERLVRVRRTADGDTREDLGGVAFVRLVGQEGWQTE